MVTIKDIADKAGVSRGTVDRVLNDRGKVRPEKAALIREVAERMGYQPNLAGKGLAARKKKLKLGFAYLGDSLAPFFSAAQKGAAGQEKVLAQYGAAVSYFSFTIEDYLRPGWVMDFVRSQNMDGWVMDGILGAKYIHEAGALGETVAPLVLFNMDVEEELRGKRLAFVGCDYENAGRLAAGVAALMTDGTARVGIVSLDDGQSPSSRIRIQGFRSEAEEQYPQIRIISSMFMKVPSDQFEFFLQAQKMIAEHPEINILYLVNPGDYSICQAIRKASEQHAIRIITNDLVLERQREMVRQGLIAATICQGASLQGSLPLQILFEYLAMGVEPRQDWYQTPLSVKIRQNV